MQLPRDKANKAMTVTQPDTLSKVGKLIRTISSALIVMENSNRPMTSRLRDEEGYGHAMFMLRIGLDACQSQHNRDDADQQR